MESATATSSFTVSPNRIAIDQPPVVRNVFTAETTRYVGIYACMCVYICRCLLMYACIVNVGFHVSIWPFYAILFADPFSHPSVHPRKIYICSTIRAHISTHARDGYVQVGAPIAGDVLECFYMYEDPDQDAEQGSEIVWFSGDAIIPDQTSKWLPLQDGFQVREHTYIIFMNMYKHTLHIYTHAHQADVSSARIPGRISTRVHVCK